MPTQTVRHMKRESTARLVQIAAWVPVPCNVVIQTAFAGFQGVYQVGNSQYSGFPGPHRTRLR